jgi:MFS transporter, DHA1 family, multidrug resistance protein
MSTPEPLPSGAGLPPDSRPPPGRAVTVNLMAQMAFGLFAMTICLPSMQEWPVLLGASQASVQLTFSLFLVSFGSLQLLFGPLSDRYGRRRLLLVGLSLAFAGMLAAALATRIETLIAARSLQGAGCAACLVICRATIQDLFEGAQRTRMMGFVSMAMGLCPPTATVLGGQMHVHFGWQSNFIMMAALTLVLMASAWHFMPVRVTAPPVQGHWLPAMGRAYARLMREPAFVLNVIVLSASSASFYAYLGGAPAVLGAYGIGPGHVGFFIMMTPLSYIVGSYLSTRLVRGHGEVWLRQVGMACALASIVLMLVLALAGVHSPFAFSGPLTLLGIGHGLLMPATLSATVGLIPAVAGAAAGASGLAQQVIGALGGYSVAWVSLDTAVPLALLMLGFSAAAALAQVALFRRGPPGPAVKQAAH